MSSAHGGSGGVAPPAQRPRPHGGWRPRAYTEPAGIAVKCFRNQISFLCPASVPAPCAEELRGGGWRCAARPRPAPPAVRSAIARPSSETRRGRDCHVLHASPPDFLVLNFPRISQEVSAGAHSVREDPQNLAIMCLACWKAFMKGKAGSLEI